MALDALELRNVAEINGMLEGFIGLVTELAFVIHQPAEIDRMNEWAHFHFSAAGSAES